ncbi:MAG: hypothetical protein Q8O89_05600 [Nanoarchaeota archaeon]|nr:hypothetical protein [Nanoarchaeota archaeon]
MSENKGLSKLEMELFNVCSQLGERLNDEYYAMVCEISKREISKDFFHYDVELIKGSQPFTEIKIEVIDGRISSTIYKGKVYLQKQEGLPTISLSEEKRNLDRDKTINSSFLLREEFSKFPDIYALVLNKPVE